MCLLPDCSGDKGCSARGGSCKAVCAKGEDELRGLCLDPHCTCCVGPREYMKKQYHRNECDQPQLPLHRECSRSSWQRSGDRQSLFLYHLLTTVI